MGVLESSSSRSPAWTRILVEGLVPELAHSLAREAQLHADLLQRLRFLVVEAEIGADD